MQDNALLRRLKRYQQQLVHSQHAAVPGEAAASLFWPLGSRP